jgi:hypothetical protein
MIMSNTIEQLRGYRANGRALARGVIPSLHTTEELGGLATAFQYAFIAAIVGFITLGVLDKSFISAFWGANIGAIVAVVVYGCWPLLAWVKTFLWRRQIPDGNFFSQFLPGQNGLCAVIVAFGLVYGANHGYPVVMSTWHAKHATPQIASESSHKLSVKRKHTKLHKKKNITDQTVNVPMPLSSTWAFGATWLVTTVLLAEAVSLLQRRRRNRSDVGILTQEVASRWR